MREALELAKKGIEAVSPNPLVGCVIVRGNRVIARGFHRRFGGAHAEVEALRAARDARGAELYVNLEPCGHHGKTPPCADAIIASGIRRVHYAVADPNPLTSGLGPRRLRAAGIEVRSGLLRREATRINRPFFHWVVTGRPWVILKWAMSLDGKIATAARESRWITGPRARALAHALRRRVDAIVAGTDTVLHDDPQLLPRPPRGRRPLRIVLDRRGRLPLGLRLLAAAPGSEPRLYVASPSVPARRLRELERRGLEVLVLKESRGRLDLDRLLEELGARGVSQLLVEGGGALAAGLVELGLADEVAAFVAPCLIGGERAPTPLDGGGVDRLADALRLDDWDLRRAGPDWIVQGIIRRR